MGDPFDPVPPPVPSPKAPASPGEVLPLQLALLILVGILSLVAVVFGWLAWGPSRHPAHSLSEGLVIIAYGIVFFGAPVAIVLAVIRALTGKRTILGIIGLVVAVPLVAVAGYFGLIFGLIVAASRDPDWSLH